MSDGDSVVVPSSSESNLECFARITRLANAARDSFFLLSASPSNRDYSVGKETARRFAGLQSRSIFLTNDPLSYPASASTNFDCLRQPVELCRKTLVLAFICCCAEASNGQITPFLPLDTTTSKL